MPSNMTGTDMRKDSEAAYTAPDVVQNVSQKLVEMQEKIGSDSSIPEPPASPAEPPEPTPEPEDGSEPESKQEPEPTQEPADDGSSTPAEPEGVAAESEGQQKPAIPDNYYRAAIHSGFKSEQISKLYEDNADETVEFLKQNYEAVNNLSRQFANLGRSAIELRQKEVAQAAPVQQPAVQKQEMDVEKLRKQYEDDPFGAMFETIKAFTSLPQEKAVEQPAAQVVQPDRVAFEEQAAALQQLHQFFNAEDMKVYSDFYGVVPDESMFDWSKLPPGQLANRRALIDEADAIITGREFQNKPISTIEAMQLAHLQLAAPMTEQIVREKITSQVKKRSKGITLKPSGSATATPTSTGTGVKSEKQALTNLEQRLPAFRQKLGFTRL